MGLILQAGLAALWLRAVRGDVRFKLFAVGECWDNERTIADWLDEATVSSDNPARLIFRSAGASALFATVTVSGGTDEEKDH